MKRTNQKKGRVIIIAMNHPLDNDAQLRRKMRNAEARAERQSSRFPDMDLSGIQKEVNQNIRNSILSLDGRYMDLLDLMNFVQNDYQAPVVSPHNVGRYYSLANTVTLNGIYLYSMLLQKGFDPVIIQNYATACLSEFLEGDLLAVCISSNFIFMDDILEIADHIKQLDPLLPIIAGGMLVKKVLDPGPRLSSQALGFFSRFQGKVDAFVVEAQGEQTLLRVLDELPKGGGLASIPNLALFDEDGEMRFTPREAEARAMNETAVSWDKIPRKYLRHTLPLNTSRGCFYRCRFCTYHWLFPEVQYKSLEVLRQELRGVQALGFVRHIRFTDDNFTADKARLRAVLEMMIEQGFDFTWSSFARASALTPGLVKLMKASGCDFVDMGIESGSQIILDNMDKRLKREQSLEAIRLLNDHGIPSRGSFIIGYPGETEKTFSETVDLINQSGLPYYHPYLFYYSWNTLVHKERERYALQGLGLAWRHRTMDAVEASYLMTQMVRLIEPGLTDGLSYIEEIYKLLRGEGYSAEEILALFKLKRELQLVGSQSSLKRPFSEAAEYIFRGLKSIVHHRSPGVGA